MKNKENIATAVKALLDECVKKMHNLYKEEEITDFYIQFNPSDNSLRIVDDEETVLATAKIGRQDTEDESETEDITTKMLKPVIQDELTKLNEAKAFDDVNVFHPFSFVLEDEDETMHDLLIVDDANLIIDDELLKGLDDDLDSFIEKLLSE